MTDEESHLPLDDELISIVWGNEINRSIFERWSQAFEFSPFEHSALVQLEGGPCSVLTPVQAHLIQQMIHSQRYSVDQWRQSSRDEIDLHFLNGLISIIDLVRHPSTDYYLCTFSASNQERQMKTPDEFHSSLVVRRCRTKFHLKEQVFAQLRTWKSSFGVILFLYSCLLTKTIKLVKSEIDDESSLPLIDCQFGHGSQALTNLLITGQATANCFDGERDLSGLKLKGIHKQAHIGFLSALEIYRLLEVGWFLKNPRYPIWILASETHLTVLFSNERFLVEQDQEKPVDKALTIFYKYDTEKNGFITNSLLDQVIQEMTQNALIKQIVPVDRLRKELDPDQLGIITKASFIHYFYPETDADRSTIEGRTFTVYHYNGLTRSNKDNEVRFVQGSATIDDFNKSSSTPSENNPHLPINSLLRTKWSTINLRWHDQHKPSLN